MVGADRSIAILCSMFPEWNMGATNVFGLLGGCAALWDPKLVALKPYGFYGSMILSGYCRNFNHRINVINLYAPYAGKLIFWSRLEDLGIIILSNLILAGDFNCSLYPHEIWGVKGRGDPLTEEMKDVLKAADLIDWPLTVN